MEIVQGAVRKLAKCQHCNNVVTRIVLFCPECGEEEFFSSKASKLQTCLSIKAGGSGFCWR